MLGYPSQAALEEAIIAFSNHVPESDRLSWVRGLPGRVFKFNSMAVKLETSETEVNNQRTARKLLDPNIVRVPEVLHYFYHHYPLDPHPTPILVMELVDGEEVADPNDAQLKQIVNIIHYMATFKGDSPGGLMGDEMEGIIFEDQFPPEPGSIDALSEWVNKRLKTWRNKGKVTKHADFSNCELVLCHLDVAPRNILWAKDGGAPWLIDWQAAGFLPWLFEIAYHDIMPKDSYFHIKLNTMLKPLTPEEEELKLMLREAWGNSIRYYYGPMPP